MGRALLDTVQLDRVRLVTVQTRAIHSAWTVESL